MEFINQYTSDTEVSASESTTYYAIPNNHSHRPYRTITVFDVETTGLIPKMDKITKRTPTINDMPHILQFSFIKYNIIGSFVDQTYDKYVKVNESIVIEPIITTITGITRETCDTRGISIIDVLTEFYNAYMSSDCVIAHNIKFDSSIIKIEIERHFHTLVKTCPHILSLFDDTFNRLMYIDMYCTMKESIHICNIMIPTKTDPTKKFKKFPQLKELYFTLFRKHPENLHNSIVDVLYTLRCFLRIKMHQEMHDAKFDYIMKSILHL
jgi:DNA polymerase III epsilon subunit-like protein